MFANIKFAPMSATTIFNGAAESTKSQKVLYPTPGLTLFSKSSISGPVRGLYTTSTGRLFAVIADSFIEVYESGYQTVWGTLKTNKGQISMADCGDGGGRGGTLGRFGKR